jgi:hypothetical protein
MALLLRRKKLNISGIGNIRIMPGINRFEDEQVKEMEKNPAWKEMLASGVHEIVTAPKAIQEDDTLFPETAKSIAEMSVKDAKAVIAGTFDVDSLGAMLDEEDAGDKRKGVFDAIDKQLEKVSSDKKDTATKEDDE